MHLCYLHDVTLNCLFKDSDPLWTYHTVHIHGHDFYTMSIGHPVTNDTTGRIIGLAPGVTCDNEAEFLIYLEFPICQRQLNSKTYVSNVPE